MLTRRNVLASGAAAGLVTAASPVFATVIPNRPRIDPALLARARAAMEQKRPWLHDTDVIAITDYSKASRDPRFYILHTASGMVTEYQVTHGRGSDPHHSGYLNYFSNVPGSEASSEGSYVTGDVYYGK